MKPIYWQYLTYEQTRDNVWANLDYRTVQLDFKLIEKEFAKKKSRKKEKKEHDPKIKKEKITFLKSERNRNMSLVLGRFRMSFVSLANAFYTCDEKILNIDALTSLKELCPSKFEIKAVLGYKGPDEDLQKADLFVKAVSVINGLEERLQGLLFRFTYKEQLEEIESNIERLYGVFD